MKSLRHLRRSGETAFVDRYTKRASHLLTDWTDEIEGAFGIIGLPLSKPSISHSGASFAPGVIRDALSSFTTYSGEEEFDLTDELIDFGDVYLSPTDVIGNQTRLYESLTDVFATEAANNWLLLGGDHSVTYSAIKAYTEKYHNIGIIQFDAHHDLRNIEDGGPTNGTPFRRLLKEQIISGENLVQIGIRDFTNAKAYHEYALEQGVTVYTMKDIRRFDLGDVLTEELNRLTQHVAKIYISLDMDVLDQAYAPGCPAIGPGGMDSQTLLDGIFTLAQYEKVTALDIVEIDPTIDFRNMTSRLAAYTILQFMKGKKTANR